MDDLKFNREMEQFWKTKGMSVEERAEYLKRLKTLTLRQKKLYLPTKRQRIIQQSKVKKQQEYRYILPIQQ